MFHFLMIMNRFGKFRLLKWYSNFTEKEQKSIKNDLCNLLPSRPKNHCNIIEYRNNLKLIFRRYASLYFIASIDQDDNELMSFEIIHFIVETLDKYYHNVCELDIIFTVHKSLYLIDEIMISGCLQDTSKMNILSHINIADSLMNRDTTSSSNNSNANTANFSSDFDPQRKAEILKQNLKNAGLF